jgi:hypothetical protein
MPENKIWFFCFAVSLSFALICDKDSTHNNNMFQGHLSVGLVVHPFGS